MRIQIDSGGRLNVSRGHAVGTGGRAGEVALVGEQTPKDAVNGVPADASKREAHLTHLAQS